MHTGRRPVDARDFARVAGAVGIGNDVAAMLTALAATSPDWPRYAETFPMAVTRDVLERGQDRFNIYCARSATIGPVRDTG